MPQPWIRGVVCALAAVFIAPAVAVRAAAPAEGADGVRALLDRYCVTCHNERLRTGNLALDEAPLDPIREHADVWEKVLLKLEERAMPPPGRRARPEPAAYDAAAAWLEAALDRAAETDPDPGRPAIHRLNRAEYANAIRDLLALEIDAPSLLPADDLGFGFDNNADLLNVSPALLERYVSAAHKVSRTAIGDARLRPAAATYEIARTRVQDQRAGEAMPFGSRGGLAVRHRFPLDGEYELRVRLQRDVVGNIYGLARGERIELRIDGEQVAVFPGRRRQHLRQDVARRLPRLHGRRRPARGAGRRPRGHPRRERRLPAADARPGGPHPAARAGEQLHPERGAEPSRVGAHGDRPARGRRPLRRGRAR